jgi:hypothetical protein
MQSGPGTDGATGAEALLAPVRPRMASRGLSGTGLSGTGLSGTGLSGTGLSGGGGVPRGREHIAA